MPNAHVYAVAAADVRGAAQQRALAMRHSDRWVREGCDLASPLVRDEREALVRSYPALLAAVHPAGLILAQSPHALAASVER